MKRQCTGEQLGFHAMGRRLVTGRFDGVRISSDAGGVLLREVYKCISVTARVSRCLVDYRNPASVKQSVDDLVAQRLYAIALGYVDLNDHGELRCDAVLSVAGTTGDFQLSGVHTLLREGPRRRFPSQTQAGRDTRISYPEAHQGGTVQAATS